MAEVARRDVPEERPTNPRRAMFPLTWWEPLVLGIASLALRLFHVGQVTNFLDDRWMNVPTAFNYVRYGLTGPDNWFTQPVKHYFMYWASALFGDDPVGWSMRQVLFGTAVVLLTFLLARRVFRAHFPAIMASVLVALDPLCISFSRAASEDPLATAFILAALLFWVQWVQEDRDRDLILAGALIGIASATRWYALLIAGLMLVMALVARRDRGGRALAMIGVCLTVVPLTAYLVWFLPWMTRGYALGDLVSVQLDSFLVQRTGAYPTFDPALAPLIGPEGWFVRWMGVSTNSAVRTFTVMMNDPVLWFFFTPAVVYMGWIAWRRRLPEHWLFVATYTALYVFFVALSRPIYLYSALQIIPIGFMAVAYAASRIMRKWSLVVFVAAVAWSLYLYPLTSAIRVPIAPYAWILARVGMGGGG